MFRTSALVAFALAAVSYGQQVGTNTAETHPTLTWEQCTGPNECTTVQGSVTLDANWRWLHEVNSDTNCYTGNEWDTSVCDSPTTCATDCALDGADYEGTYGVSTSGSTLRLDFITAGSDGLTNVGSRLYLLENDSTYQMFKPLNQEFTFDVNVANLPCGLNGAVYFSQMDSDGGVSRFPTNKAGAAYGTGYCDSQCPRDLKFIDGAANILNWTAEANSANSGTGQYGSCCGEMDIWESNSISTAYTPHPCTVDIQTQCSGTECGAASTSRYAGYCDPDGCDFNSYREGDLTFYGPGSGFTVNTDDTFTVVTQFITSDGTDTGTLSAIKRFYVQNGVVIPNSNIDITGVPADNYLTDAICTSQKTAFGDEQDFSAKGGMTAMGESMEAGMVLVLSLWDDYTADMLWLDSVYPTNLTASQPGAARGTCATTSGVPATVESQDTSAYVTYANIKFGPINSTFTA